MVGARRYVGRTDSRCSLMTAPSATPRPTISDAVDARGGPALSVVVPTYNEAENIDDLLDRLAIVLADIDHEIIVVDDDSPDETWRFARARADTDTRIRVVRRLSDRGLASAVLAGTAGAAGRVIRLTDAHLTHD